MLSLPARKKELTVTRTTKKKSAALPRREPKGDKGKRSKSLIQDAITDLVSVDGLGLSEIKLDRICKKAGLTIGAFYFHFANKDAAIQETAIDALTDLKAEILSLPQRDDLRSELEQIVSAYIRSIVDNPKSTRLVYTAVRGSPAVHEFYVDMHYEIADRLEKLVADERSRAGQEISDCRLIVEFLMAGIESLVENIYMWNSERTAGLGRDPKILTEKLAHIWVSIVSTKFSQD